VGLKWTHVKTVSQCVSPAWRAIKPAKLFTIPELSEAILQTSDIEGITLSGGEPMLQAGKLHQLVFPGQSRPDLDRNLLYRVYSGGTPGDWSARCD